MFGPLPNSTYPLQPKVTQLDDDDDDDEELLYETWWFIFSLGLLM